MREKNGEHPFGDTGQLIALGLFLAVWVGDSFFLRASTFLADYAPLAIRLIVCGLVLIAAMILGRSGHSVAGEERRPDRVVTSGAFRYVRHPLYLASMLAYFGLTVATASLFSLAVCAGAFVFYDYIAGYEERLLEARFGEEYLRYRRVTGKWAPKIGAFGPKW